MRSRFGFCARYGFKPKQQQQLLLLHAQRATEASRLELAGSHCGLLATLAAGGARFPWKREGERVGEGEKEQRERMRVSGSENGEREKQRGRETAGKIEKKSGKKREGERERAEVAVRQRRWPAAVSLASVAEEAEKRGRRRRKGRGKRRKRIKWRDLVDAGRAQIIKVRGWVGL